MSFHDNLLLHKYFQKICFVFLTLYTTLPLVHILVLSIPESYHGSNQTIVVYLDVWRRKLEWIHKKLEACLCQVT